MCIFIVYRCPDCRQCTFKAGETCNRALSNAPFCRSEVKRKDAPEKEYTKLCDYCDAMKQGPGWNSVNIPSGQVPAVRYSPIDGNPRYWHFNPFPELNLSRNGWTSEDWQELYGLAREQAPYCLDVLPFEDEPQFKKRVAPLRDTSPSPPKLAEHYNAWWHDANNRDWLPRNRRYTRLLEADVEWMERSKAPLPMYSTPWSYSAADGRPRKFTPEPLTDTERAASTLLELAMSEPAESTSARSSPGPREEGSTTADSASGSSSMPPGHESAGQTPTQIESTAPNGKSHPWPGVPSNHVWVINGKFQTPRVWLEGYKEPFKYTIDWVARYQHAQDMAQDDLSVLPYETMKQFSERAGGLGTPPNAVLDEYRKFRDNPDNLAIFPRDEEGKKAAKTFKSRLAYAEKKGSGLESRAKQLRHTWK